MLTKQYDFPMTPSVCPGYTTGLPAVGQAYEAYAWWNTGQLGIYFDGEVPDYTKDLINLCHRAVKSLEAHQHDKRKEDLKRGH